MPDDQWLIDLRPSLFLTGILHVIHNITSSLPDTLIWFELFEYYLTHISRLLKRKYSCDRLLESCFQREPHSLYRKEIKAFDGAVYKGRWATLLDACHQLLPLEGPLRSAWDLDAYTGAPDEQCTYVFSRCKPLVISACLCRRSDPTGVVFPILHGTGCTCLQT
jgi:hypothetical protein